MYWSGLRVERICNLHCYCRENYQVLSACENFEAEVSAEGGYKGSSKAHVFLDAGMDRQLWKWLTKCTLPQGPKAVFSVRGTYRTQSSCVKKVGRALWGKIWYLEQKSLGVIISAARQCGPSALL